MSASLKLDECRDWERSQQARSGFDGIRPVARTGGGGALTDRRVKAMPRRAAGWEAVHPIGAIPLPFVYGTP